MEGKTLLPFWEGAPCAGTHTLLFCVQPERDDSSLAWAQLAFVPCDSVLGGFVPEFPPLQAHLNPFCAFMCIGAAGVGLELHCGALHLLEEKATRKQKECV